MSKRYRSACEKVDSDKAFELKEALDLLLSLPSAKFDETVELTLQLTPDPKDANTVTRGVVQLPNGNGKTVRVIAFTENAVDAKKAGAKEAGLADLIEKVQGGWLDFDVAVATVEAMKDVKVLARVLGPRGLMPSPKAGTVIDDDKLTDCIQALQKGRVEFKSDKTSHVQLGVGKRSFGVDKLVANIEAILEAIKLAKPASINGKFILGGFLSSTMSPSIRLNSSLFA